MSELDLFKCEPLKAKLSRRACGKRWLYANNLKGGKVRSQVEMRYVYCQGCKLGEAHAKLIDIEELKPQGRGGALSHANMSEVREKIQQSSDPFTPKKSSKLKVSAKPVPKVDACGVCGANKHVRQKYCSRRCSHKGRSKVDWSKEDLLELRKTMSYCAMARHFGVSESIIRRQHKKQRIERGG